MIIGYDGRILANLKCGIAVYLINLIKYYIKEASIERIYLFSDKPLYKIYSSLISHPKIQTEVFAEQSSKRWAQFKLPPKLRKYSIDIYHAVWNKAVPLFSPCPVILTIHDLVPWVIGGFKNKRKEYRYKLQTFICAHRANRIITVSNNSKFDIMKFLKINESKIEVIYNALDEEKQNLNLKERNPQHLLNRFNIDKKYIICVSGIDMPRRNIEILIKAYLDLVSSKKYDVRLVLIGNINRNNPYTYNILESIKRHNLSKDIILTGWMDDYDFMLLLKEAKFMVFPSLYEGFGFPILEAFWAATPTIVAESSSLLEVAGDAVLYFDPMSSDDLLSKMITLLKNDELRNQLSKKGNERLKKFNWQKASEETLNVYRSLFRGR